MTEPSNKESPDYSRPMAVLKKCHERIRLECDTLRGLVEHVRQHGCDEKARQTAANAIRYFDTAAHIHHEDEEQDLLPRMMMASTMSRGSTLTRMVADIDAEHREIDHSWNELRATLQQVTVNRETLEPLQVDRFVKLYKTHIAIEESNVFPLAEMLLTNQDLAAIGANMAKRRGKLKG